MTVADIIHAFRNTSDYSRCLSHMESISERVPVYGTLKKQFPEEIVSYLHSRGIKLYSHQCESADAIREGENIILTTATASGKTLAFSLPVFDLLRNNSSATALYLYPTKALSNDQLKSVLEIESKTGICINPAIYDGDTPKEKRQLIRNRSRIVISNPYELHCILPWHHQWSRFYKNLCVVVIDEAHQYRGVSGSNMALLIRRLRRICVHYGNDPVFILSSATIANPGEFAERLIGKPVRCISVDGSPRGKKNFVFFNPFSDGDMTRAGYRESGKILKLCIDNDVRALCFTGSRKLTELITLQVRDELLHSKSGDPSCISAYRAGYLADERRSIEDRMKSGRLKGIVSTNALELGIDVGALEGVIMTGFPGSIMSTWQQAGRAGRTAGESLAVLVAGPDPLDQYFMKHPDIFFLSSHEKAIIDLNNPYILSGHVLCAAAELPVQVERDTIFFGSDLEPLLNSLSGEHLVSNTRRGWVYSGVRRPVELTSLTNITSDVFKVVCNGVTIETMDRSQAFREAHEGAILYHQGEKFQVVSMDLERKIIRIETTDVDFYTKPIQSIGVRIIREEKCRTIGNYQLSFGDVLVTEQCTAYRIVRFDTVIGVEPLSLPALQFQTRAIWFGVPEETASESRDQGTDFGGGLHGVEHALIAVMPLHVLCDRRDIGGFSSTMFPGEGEPMIAIYDGYEGGIGLSENAFTRFEEIVAMTYDLVRSCACETGCPACIYSPKCGNDNLPLDKKATLNILWNMVRSELATDSACALKETRGLLPV